MQPRRTDAGDRVVVVAACLLAVAANILAQALWGAVEPYVSFAEHALMAAVGIAFAGLAAVAAVGGKGVVVALALAAAFAQTAAPLAGGLQQLTPTWTLILACAPIVGAVAAWLAVASPSGRAETVSARVAGTTAVVVALAAAVSTVTLYDPAAWGWCRCEGAVFAPAADPGVYLAVRRAIAVAWGIAAIAVLVTTVRALRRARTGRTDALLAASALILAGAWSAGAIVAIVSIAGRATSVALAEQAALLLISASLAARLVARRASRGRVADVLASVRAGVGPAALERQLARALGDPALVVHWRDGQHFRDANGALTGDPRHELAVDRSILVVDADERIVALVTHDHALDADPALLDAVAQALRLWSENLRLTAELSDSLVQVRESRQRIVTATDDARRRIERDLHDGAQQLLVSAGLSLAAASARAGGDPRLSDLLADTSGKLDQALIELRELATGIAPTALAHGSLADALGELALRSAVPVSVEVEGSGEPPERIRSTIYFVVAESLANVAKHTRASAVRVTLRLGDPAVVTIADDGEGGAIPASGSGLRGLADRVEALGGSFAVTSGPGGTTIAASVGADAGS